MLTALLVAGCATMPDTGDPRRVPPAEGAGANNGVQVRVIPVAPRDGQSAREVLQNFLDASIADEGKYETARAYLTDDATKTWNPESGVVVLDATNPGEPVAGVDPLHTEISLTSSQIGQLDAKHSFTSSQDSRYVTRFTLVNEAKEGATKPRWRIAVLPDGLIVNRTNFRNTYQQVDRYFFTAEDPTVAGAQPTVLVPDPVYLRRRTDPANAALLALAQGASDWLTPVVRSAFDGTRLVGGIGGDDPRRPRVTIDGADLSVSKLQCQKMVAQLYFTLAGQGGSGSIDSVSLSSVRRGGCDLSSAQAKSSPYAPGSLAGSGQAYFRRYGSGQLLRQDSSSAVPGPLGTASPPPALLPTGSRPASPFAVARDGRSAAVVGQDGRSLYLVGLLDGAKLGDPVAVSHGPGPDQALGSPSWDGFGGLWVVDRDPAAPRVLLIRGQSSVTVNVDPLGGRTVDGIRLSSDGTRAALVLKDASKATSLWLGRVVRSGSPEAPVVEISEVRPIAPQLSDVTSVSWADSDLLLALGKESDSVPQLHYVGMDGLQNTDSALQAVDGMTVVAASESRADPVLADSTNAKDSTHAIYSLGGSGQSQSQWRSIARDGAQPAYPG